MNDRSDELTPRLFSLPNDERAELAEELDSNSSEATRTRSNTDRSNRKYRVAGNPLEALKLVLASTNKREP